MPAKGYKKENPHNKVLQVRATDEQHEAWEEAAGEEGYTSLSAWVRDTLDDAAGYESEPSAWVREETEDD